MTTDRDSFLDPPGIPAQGLPLPDGHQERALCVMVLGTTSGAGKSWVTTALCRWYARQGLRVMPFKAQNMSNNARVVPGMHGDWGEIGTAQYLQALAARAEPQVGMNPLLLKPEADMRSQVVLLGQARPDLSRLAWRERSLQVWNTIAASLDELRASCDVVVIEGAGSPAEINLLESDVVNMRVARHCNAHCLLVADIDRGGAFAHLYGTWALLPAQDRRLIRGFVLNRFRGDESLLAPAPAQLESLTGVPVVAVIPMQTAYALPEEDGLFDAPVEPDMGAPQLTIAVVAYPRVSNLDEFQPLRRLPGIRLVWARTPRQLQDADWVVLPGSKATASDLAWMRDQGLDAALARHVERKGLVLGICGGLQMLGESLADPHGVDGSATGLGLLPLVTEFSRDKTLKRATVAMPALDGAWRALSGLQLQVYEIHHGTTRTRDPLAARELVSGVLWQSPDTRILGSYWHGMFENAGLLRALFGASGETGGGLDDIFDQMADGVERWFAQPCANALAGACRDAPIHIMNMSNTSIGSQAQSWADRIAATANPTLQARVQQRLDEKTKPPGSLGQLERMALRLALIQARPDPVLLAPQMMVFAGDHGIVRQGVSAFPAEVTPQMVRNFLQGGAAVSVLSRCHGLHQIVVDCGVNADFVPHPDLVSARVPGLERGCRDSTQGPAMSIDQCLQAIENGAAAVRARPGNAILLGEMGIGNTSPASMLMHRLAGIPLEACVGRGTGLDNAGVQRKLATLERALAVNASADSPLAWLAALGGLEIAAMVGAVLQAAAERRLVVVDGFITTAAVATAAALAPRVLDYCLFAHSSAESGHARWLKQLGVEAILDLDLRLGEGSGAALCWPIIAAAARILNEMSSFASAGVSTHDAQALHDAEDRA